MSSDMSGFPVRGAPVMADNGVIQVRAGDEPVAAVGTDVLQIFAGAIPSTVNAIPQMTSLTAPSGVASASSSYSLTPAWHAFGSAPVQRGWINNGDGLPCWLKYQFPAPKIINGYAIGPWDVDTFPGRCLATFKLQGSNDDSTWVDLHSVAAAGTWTVGVNKTYSFINKTAYIYYRIYITANGGNQYTGTRNVALYEPTYALCAMTPAGARVVFTTG